MWKTIAMVVPVLPFALFLLAPRTVPSPRRDAGFLATLGLSVIGAWIVSTGKLVNRGMVMVEGPVATVIGLSIIVAAVLVSCLLFRSAKRDQKAAVSR